MNVTLRLSYARPGRWWRRSRIVQATVEVLDLSTGGALLRSPPQVALEPQALVRLATDAGRAVAGVRHQAPTPASAAWRFYGVAFTDTDPAFDEWLLDQLGGRELLPAWVRAR